MVDALLPKIRTCQGKFQAHSIAKAINGMQRMSSEWLPVRQLLEGLTPHLHACQGLLSSQDASLALYGLQGMNGTLPEVQALLSELLCKINTDTDTGHWGVQDVSLAFLGLHDIKLGPEWNVLLQEWLQTLASASLGQARMAYQSLALVLGLSCCLRTTLESFTTHERLLLLQEQLKKRWQKAKVLPKKLSSNAEMYKKQAHVAFADQDKVGVTTAEVLFGFECDIVLRQDDVVVNVQLQEEDYPLAGRHSFSYLRDQLLQQNGVRVLGVQTRGKSSEQALEFFNTL